MINVTQKKKDAHQKAPKRIKKRQSKMLEKMAMPIGQQKLKFVGDVDIVKKNITTSIYTKCDVRLCFVERRNYFIDIHN